MECTQCGGRMMLQKAPFATTWRNYQLSWDALPAWVCPHCGERKFDAPAMAMVQQALETISRSHMVASSMQ